MKFTPLVLVIALGAAPHLASQATAPAAIGVAIERRFADAAHLHVGDSVRLSTSDSHREMVALIEAIYDPRADPATIMRRDYHVRLHLGDLGDLLNEPDRVDRIGIALAPGVNPDTAAEHFNRTAFGYQVTPSRAIASQSSATFLVVSRFHRAIGLISVLASTIFLLCLMLLKVEERRRDVALLRFTGISRRTVFLALMFEAALLALAGSVIGAALAAGASVVINSYYQRAFATTLIFSEVTLSTVVIAAALAVGLGVGAGAVAAWRLVATPPIQLWNRSA